MAPSVLNCFSNYQRRRIHRSKSYPYRQTVSRPDSEVLPGGGGDYTHFPQQEQIIVVIVIIIFPTAIIIGFDLFS